MSSSSGAYSLMGGFWCWQVWMKFPEVDQLHGCLNHRRILACLTAEWDEEKGVEGRVHQATP
jgi:hypothetical protein